MNPRAAINDLLPFQGSPFSLLGTSPNIAETCFYSITIVCKAKSFNGEDGIRTHAPSRTNGFQDRLVMTTSIPLHVVSWLCLSADASVILTELFFSVNNFLLFFYIFFSIIGRKHLSAPSIMLFISPPVTVAESFLQF